MKKKFCIILVSIISVLCLAFGLSACSVKAEFKVSFVVDGQTIHTINTNGNEIITMPPDPQKDDYIFDGWYWDKDVWEKPFTANSLLDAPLSSNMSVYCKWRPEHEHAFTKEVIEDKYKASGASCTEKSKYYYSCKCGEKGTETFEYGKLLPHTEETVAGKAASCTETGLTDGKKCSVCHTVLVEQTTIPVKEHTEETVTGKTATCTETGLTDGKKCSVCGETLQVQTTIPLKEHTEETVTGKPASCTENGLTDGKRCAVCHTVLEAQETIPAAHVPTAWITDKNSTCTEKGSRHKECVVCESVLTTEEIALVPHAETTIYGKVPTCTDSGLTNGKLCSVCGQTIAAQTVIPANGHKYDNGVCLSCGVEQAPATISEVTGGTINDLDIYMFVEHDVTEVNLLRIVTCSPKSTWKLYEDKRGQREIATKIASGENDELNDGNNVFYIVATSANGIDVNTYTLTIYRSYAITVKYYNGSELDRTDNVYTGHDYTADYAPEYRGYTLNCWKNSGETFTNAVLWDNLVLIAGKTAHTFTVSFVTDGKAQAVESLTATYDQEITLPASSKTGYTFNGWLDGDDISENTFVWNFIEDKEYTAKFTANEYTITYIPNGGTLANTTQTVTFDSAYILYEISRTGYTFAKYMHNGEVFASGTYTIAGDIEINVEWTPTTYKIKYELNGGTLETSVNDYHIEKSVTFDSPEKDYYDFAGWYDNASLSGTAVIGIALGNYGNKTFYAKWTPTTYAITYELNGGTLSTTKNGYGIESTVTFDSPAKNYYDFVGWYDNAELTGDTVTGIEVGNYGAKTFYAKWAPHVYSITYELNDGTLETQVNSYHIEQAVSFDTPEKAGCDFAGWYDNSDLSNEAINGIDVGNYGNKTFYAKWIPIIYTIAYELNEGIDNGNFKTEFTINDLPLSLNFAVPYFENYLFGGWYTESGFENQLTEISEIGNKTLYAKWENAANYFTFSKSYNGYTVTGYNGSFTDIAIPTTYNDLPVVGIDISAFEHCSSLTSLTIPDSVTYIGKWAFLGCSSLTSVTIGNGVRSIGDLAFFDCSLITNIYITDIASWCGISGIEYLMKYVAANTNLYLNGELITELVIPDSVTRIGDFAFRCCSSLTSVTIGKNVTRIGIYAFQACSALTSVTIGYSVTTIGEYAFYGCRSLTSATFKRTGSWRYASFEGVTNGTMIPYTHLSDPSIAATYLKTTYRSYYWNRD